MESQDSFFTAAYVINSQECKRILNSKHVTVTSRALLVDNVLLTLRRCVCVCGRTSE